MKGIPILMPKNKHSHNRMLVEAILLKGKDSSLFKNLGPNVSLAKHLSGWPLLLKKILPCYSFEGHAKEEVYVTRAWWSCSLSNPIVPTYLVVNNLLKFSLMLLLILLLHLSWVKLVLLALVHSLLSSISMLANNRPTVRFWLP